MNNMNHIIRFHDGSKKEISENQANFINAERKKGNVSGIDTPTGGFLSFSSISKILPKNEYYDQYPNERPQDLFTDPKVFEERPMGINGIIAATNSTFALEQIKKGVERYMRSTEERPLINPEGKKNWYKGTEEPLNLIALIEKKIKLTKLHEAA